MKNSAFTLTLSNALGIFALFALIASTVLMFTQNMNQTSEWAVALLLSFYLGIASMYLRFPA